MLRPVRWDSQKSEGGKALLRRGRRALDARERSDRVIDLLQYMGSDVNSNGYVKKLGGGKSCVFHSLDSIPMPTFAF